MALRGLEGETLVGPASSGLLNDGQKQFLSDVFNTGALEYLDAVTVHPYADWPEQAVTGANSYQSFRALMHQHGTVKPIVSGEWGWNTCTKPCENNGGNWGNYDLSEQWQANLLARQWLTNWLHSVASIFYEWRVNKPGSHSFEGQFGTVGLASYPDDYHNASYPYDPKPAYITARSLQNIFGTMHKITRIDCCGEFNMILRATNTTAHTQEVRYAIWQYLQDDPVTIRVPLSPAGCYTIRNTLGYVSGHVCTTDDNQAIEVEARSGPTYFCLQTQDESMIVV